MRPWNLCDPARISARAEQIRLRFPDAIPDFVTLTALCIEMIGRRIVEVGHHEMRIGGLTAEIQVDDGAPSGIHQSVE